MSKITIVGLGPGDIDLISKGALDALKNSKHAVLRTKEHPIVERLIGEGVEFDSLDRYYETECSFEAVYSSIAEHIVSMAQGGVVYAVPGHPRVAENTVSLIEKLACEKGIELEIIPSMSFVDAMFNSLGFDPSDGFVLLDALSFKSRELSSDKAVIITQVYSKLVASDTKLKLMEHYDDDQGIYVVGHAGIKGSESIVSMPLYELDHYRGFDHLTSVYVPRGSSRKFKGVSDLEDIMEKLRSKDGCPWDIKQTHKSIKKCLIEEAYELADAIENDDVEGMIEELGDVLLQVVFHSQIGKEEGMFNLDEVADSICKKLIYRHPHVFGEDKYEESTFMKKWEDMKKAEKGEETVAEGLERIPRHLPALIRAHKVQTKAAYVGFDWEEIEDVYKKVREEYKEVVDAHAAGDIQYIQEELGDLLFSIVNLARFLKVDPEESLNGTTEKFIRRFKFIEIEAAKMGKNIQEMTLEEMDILWEAAKKVLG